jgi:hypothetical protein
MGLSQFKPQAEVSQARLILAVVAVEEEWVVPPLDKLLEQDLTFLFGLVGLPRFVVLEALEELAEALEQPHQPILETVEVAAAGERTLAASAAQVVLVSPM